VSTRLRKRVIHRRDRAYIPVRGEKKGRKGRILVRRTSRKKKNKIKKGKKE